ncbi:hypothetical protein B566_EDAN004396 [Ephemera danica]|nr:hypothetical protein B566_EDAN004396 [Ephemera danica]
MNRIFYIIPIIGIATSWLILLTTLAAPKKLIDGHDKPDLQFPSNLQELQELAKLLSAYYSTNWVYVLVLFSSAYLYKQSFMIPGSVLLVAGALFGLYIAFPLVCLLTGIGASCCFLLSKHLGQQSLQQRFPNKILWLQSQVESNRERLPYFLLFLRLFPMSPNWLLNVLCPHAGIPLHLFAFTATIGLMPYNYVCVHAGCMLASLTSLDSLFSATTLLQMAFLALVALGPSFIIKKYSKSNKSVLEDKKLK